MFQRFHHVSVELSETYLPFRCLATTTSIRSTIPAFNSFSILVCLFFAPKKMFTAPLPSSGHFFFHYSSFQQ
jgi:hypothetical protein